MPSRQDRVSRATSILTAPFPKKKQKKGTLHVFLTVSEGEGEGEVGVAECREGFK